MSIERGTTTPKRRVGDWVEAHGLPGQSGRRGQITEVIGEGDHEHYRVRWDERHESILYPADGVVVVGRHRAGSGAPGRRQLDG